MRHKMFVFFGLPNEGSNSDISLLLENLNTRFSAFLKFSRKQDLLMSRIDDVDFYASILKTEKEMADWIQMGKDFELPIDLTILNYQILKERYDQLRVNYPNLYSDTHYAVAKTIFEELNKFTHISIYSFQ